MTEMQDGTYHVQFVCATPGSYEISAFVDGNKLPMCLGPGDWPRRFAGIARSAAFEAHLALRSGRHSHCVWH